MQKVTPTTARKADHIRINLQEDTSSGITTGLEQYRFVHQALPEINFNDINFSVDLFGKTLSKPLLISSMTGGTLKAGRINRNLAIAAQETGIALGLGSQRAALENPNLVKTYRVRHLAPDILLLANLGAIQLNNGYGVDECRSVVDMINADGLILHLNPLQEALQPEGDTNFADLLSKIENVCKHLATPVIVKEVGWGISKEVALQLYNAGVSAIDTAGAGGTSWSQVEMHRANSPSQIRLAKTFVNWGIPTAESILNVSQTCPNVPIIASGGIRSGQDVAKSIALGAVIAGIAGPFLKAAEDSPEELIKVIDEYSNILRVIMFATGSANLSDLPKKIKKLSSS